MNLSKNAAKAVQAGTPMVKDTICRLIFLNFSVDEEKVLSCQLNPPFDELLKTRSVLSSRVGAIELEPLVESIWKHWDYTKFDTNLPQYQYVQVQEQNFIY